MPIFQPDFFHPLGKNNFATILPKVVDFSKDIKYLEIGSFHGASTYFMFNSLLNQTSSATIVDPFENSKSEAIGDFEKFKYNMNEYLNRIVVCKDYSVNVLDNLEKESFDIVYIDGSHLATDVYYDLEHTLPLVKPGGIVICDDYLWWLLGWVERTDISGKPFNFTQPMKAINKFIKNKKDEIENITQPLLLELDESNSDLVLTPKEIDSLLCGNFEKLTKNGINEPNYQFIFRKK